MSARWGAGYIGAKSIPGRGKERIVQVVMEGDRTECLQEKIRLIHPKILITEEETQAIRCWLKQLWK